MSQILYKTAVQLNHEPNNQFTATLPPNSGYHRQDGSPAQPGDVYSVQPDGSIQARPKGTNGVWELCTREGVALLFTGTGTTVILLPSEA